MFRHITAVVMALCGAQIAVKFYINFGKHGFLTTFCLVTKGILCIYGIFGNLLIVSDCMSILSLTTANIVFNLFKYNIIRLQYFNHFHSATVGLTIFNIETLHINH